MDSKKTVLIVVTLVLFIICLVMINTLINPVQKTAAPQERAVPRATVKPPAAATAGAPAAEESDPASYSGPMLR